MSTAERVHVVTELEWRFHDGNGGNPTVWPKLEPGGRYVSSIPVDPFPAYGHDPELVRTTLERVTASFPLPEPFAPVVFLLGHEVLSRTNGQEHIAFDYDWEPPDDDPKDEGHQRAWRGYIILSAKRIPPHPAMTRYLVAHEYGHVVEDWLIRQRRERAQSQDLLHEYADRRGIPPSELQTSAGGGSWHRAVQEIFANDFRLLRTSLETEFWPHPGFDRPETLPAIVEFWEKAH